MTSTPIESVFPTLLVWANLSKIARGGLFLATPRRDLGLGYNFWVAV